MNGLITNTVLTLCLAAILGCSNQMASMKGVPDDPTGDDIIIKKPKIPPDEDPPPNNLDEDPPPNNNRDFYYRFKMVLIAYTKVDGWLSQRKFPWHNPIKKNNEAFVDIRGRGDPSHFKNCEEWILRGLEICLKDKTRQTIYRAKQNGRIIDADDADWDKQAYHRQVHYSYDIAPKADNTHKSKRILLSCYKWPTASFSELVDKVIKKLKLEHTPQNGSHEMYNHQPLYSPWLTPPYDGKRDIFIPFEIEYKFYSQENIPADSCFN